MDNSENLEQGTQLWKDARAGCATASCVANLFVKARKENQGARANYRAKIICEILTGRVQEDEINSYQIRQGKEREPDARTMYELQSPEPIITVGFIKHPTIERYGASPDMLVGKNGLCQIKCPTRAVHLSWLMTGIVPKEHKPQMYAEMDCCDRQWNEFCSYNPDFPETMQLFRVRLERNEGEIEKIRTEVRKFNAEIDSIISRLHSQDEDLVPILEESLKAAKK